MKVKTDVATAAAGSPCQPGCQRATKTVLVVEDEPILRELVVRQLREQGYNVFQAPTAADALSMWPDCANDTDLLFTDIVMPGGLSGRELAERLLAEKPALKVIYTSGCSIDIFEQGFSLRRGIRFLQKPYRPTALTDAIRECLAGR